MRHFAIFIITYMYGYMCHGKMRFKWNFTALNRTNTERTALQMCLYSPWNTSYE